MVYYEITMKIGLVCPYNIALGGGVQEIIRATHSHLKRRGHTVKIITAQPRDLSDVDISDMIFLGRAIDVQWPNHTTAPLSSGLSMEAIEQVMEIEQFDILHFHEPWVPALSRQILSSSRSVNIATFHAKVPETIMSRTLSMVITPYMRAVLKDLHELTAVSEPATEYVSSLTDRAITIIPNGIDLRHFTFRPQLQTQTPQTILYIGRLEGRKGLKHLLQAFGTLLQAGEDIQLVIAGEGPDRRKLELFVSELAIPQVTFLGYVSDQKKLELLASADVFCTPALFGESFGIVLLEAMASGLPAVAGNNSGYASVMQGVGALSLINPKDTVEFARRLHLFLHEPSLRNMWLDWAKAYVQHFSYEHVVDQYEALYEAALENHAKVAVGI
jgi:phosphatidyl-myo-inositol alpha-mannosyltransferase